MDSKCASLEAMAGSPPRPCATRSEGSNIGVSATVSAVRERAAKLSRGVGALSTAGGYSSCRATGSLEGMRGGVRAGGGVRGGAGVRGEVRCAAPLAGANLSAGNAGAPGPRRRPRPPRRPRRRRFLPASPASAEDSVVPCVDGAPSELSASSSDSLPGPLD